MSQEDAQKAVQVVIDCLKSKLPPAIASHLDSFMADGGGLEGLEAEAGEMLGRKNWSGLFGNKGSASGSV